jgi:hypothetical protein
VDPENSIHLPFKLLSGVLLTDGKIDDQWQVTFTTAGVGFFNGSLDVSLTKLK